MHHSVLSQFASESITVGAASTALTAATMNRPGGGVTKGAVITVEDDDIRFNTGGADAGATDQLLPAGSILIIEGIADLRRARFIRETTDAVIRVKYYE